MRSHHATLALCLAYVAALVLVAIGVDRVLAGQLFAAPERFTPTFESYYHPTASRKLNDVESGPRDWDALFIGNSLTMLDVDPRVFDQRMAERGRPVTSYNLAIPSMAVEFWPEFFARWYRWPVPRDLLLGIQPRDLDARGEAITRPLIAQFFASDGYRNRDMSSVSKGAEEALADAFVLWGRHGSFFPAAAARAKGGRYDPDDIQVYGDQGAARINPGLARSPAELEAGRDRYGARPGGTFAMSAAARGALAELARMQRERGGRLVLFTMPVFYDSEPEGRLGVTPAFRRAVSAWARATPGAEFLDPAAGPDPGFGVQDFGDENHLDEAGARKFSSALADAVAGLR